MKIRLRFGEANSNNTNLRLNELLFQESVSRNPGESVSCILVNIAPVFMPKVMLII
jgi:hypothetical protein